MQKGTQEKEQDENDQSRWKIILKKIKETHPTKIF